MALSIYTAEQLSTLPFLKETDLLKKTADGYKPLPKETEERVLQKFRLDWNYHSNAIEGNKLTYGETVAFIIEGVTAKGKTLKDHLDIQGHDEAVKYLVSLIKEKEYLLTEADIRNLHKMILKEPYRSDAVTTAGLYTTKEIRIGQYKSMSNHVKTPTGEIHQYATPEDTPIKMGELMEFYKTAKNNKHVHPLVLAALFHHEFTAIHPFDDGNGRIGRLLMNLMLMQDGYPPVVVKQEDRLNYYQVLRQTDVGELIPIVEYMSELLKHSLNIYVKAARGESIEEEEDIDKEIALFKKGLGEDKITQKKSPQLIEQAIKGSIMSFINALLTKLAQLEPLFVEVTKTIRIDNNYNSDPIALNDNNLRNVDEIFQSENEFETNGEYNIHSLNITVSFRGFKKTDGTVVLDLAYVVGFQDFEYSLREQNSPDLILRQWYGKEISPQVIKQACAGEVKKFIQKLKQYSS